MAGRDHGQRGRTKADGAWKRVLTDLLPDLVAFAAPRLHEAVDWSVAPISLDKEFQSVARQAGIGPRVVDHLVQLRLLTGGVGWLVLHVEVQGQPQPDFAARMYTYAALLHLRLWRQGRRGSTPGEPPPLILGLAILTDTRADWHPGPYTAEAFGHGLRYSYWTLKLLDWRERREGLLASGNPFALVMAVWLGRLAAGQRTDDLLAVARAALRQLRRSGFDDVTQAAFLAFLEQAIALLTALLEQLLEELASEEEVAMAQVMSSFERAGLRKGRQEGRQEERVELTLLLLAHRFGPLDEATTARISALDPARLLALYTAALDFTERAALDRWLDGAVERGGVGA